MTGKSHTSGGDDNVPVYSVSEISQALKRTVEGAFGYVRVRGEISGFKRAGSGHLYFALKDADAVLDAVCWRSTAGRIRLAPEDGMEVIATGRLTTYAGRSRYQIVVESLELAGEGALLKLLEDRRKRLAEEGLFDAGRKRALPYLPEVIGVVTSPTGAVIRDIIHRIDDRFPRRVLLWPVLVQGEGAAEQVAAAIGGFNALAEDGAVPRPDVLIVARGGGSLEDLWAFNEEIVVRAAAASAIPLISAVGHETDTTLIDFASDVRAPTPTAAAEMAVPVRLELVDRLGNDAGRLTRALHRLVRERQSRLSACLRGLPNLRRVIEEASQRVDDWAERLDRSLGVGLERRRSRVAELAARIPHPRPLLGHAENRLAAQATALERAGRTYVRDRAARLERAAALLESYSYRRTLERGFVLARDDDGAPVRSAASVETGMGLTLEFHDGRAHVTADGGGADGATAAGGGGRKAPAGKTRRKSAADERQGKLL